MNYFEYYSSFEYHFRTILIIGLKFLKTIKELLGLGKLNSALMVVKNKLLIIKTFNS